MNQSLASIGSLTAQADQLSAILAQTVRVEIEQEAGRDHVALYFVKKNIGDWLESGTDRSYGEWIEQNIRNRTILPWGSVDPEFRHLIQLFFAKPSGVGYQVVALWDVNDMVERVNNHYQMLARSKLLPELALITAEASRRGIELRYNRRHYR